MRFLECKTCNNIMMFIDDRDVTPMCCGDMMNEMKPNTNEDGSKEKHIPEVSIKDRNVNIQVGSILHPSTSEHHIEWILLETTNSKYIKYLMMNEEPIIEFMIGHNENVLNVYAYCNLHGLWKKECALDEGC